MTELHPLIRVVLTPMRIHAVNVSAGKYFNMNLDDVDFAVIDTAIWGPTSAYGKPFASQMQQAVLSEIMQKATLRKTPP